MTVLKSKATLALAGLILTTMMGAAALAGPAEGKMRHHNHGDKPCHCKGAKDANAHAGMDKHGIRWNQGPNEELRFSGERHSSANRLAPPAPIRGADGRLYAQAPMWSDTQDMDGKVIWYDKRAGFDKKDWKGKKGWKHKMHERGEPNTQRAVAPRPRRLSDFNS